MLAADVLTLARSMDAQHPAQWTPGAWYPATLPDGRGCEIKRVSARGARFLHIRREVPRVIVHAGTGEREQFGTTYLHVRVNLTTGENSEVN